MYAEYAARFISAIRVQTLAPASRHVALSIPSIPFPTSTVLSLILVVLVGI